MSKEFLERARQRTERFLDSIIIFTIIGIIFIYMKNVELSKTMTAGVLIVICAMTLWVRFELQVIKKDQKFEEKITKIVEKILNERENT